MSLTGLLCALLLSVVASTSTAAAFSPDGPRATGLPLVEVIGCRMINGNLVCDRSGTLLPNRLRRPKATVKPQKKTVRPVQRKSPSKKSNTARQAPPQNDEDVGTAADAELDDEAEDSGEVTCPPGWVPLDEPDEKGAVCEPESERSVTAPADSEPPSSAENGDAPSFKPAPEDAAEPDYIFETAPPGPEGSAAPSPSLAPAGQQPSAPTPPPNLESDKTPAEQDTQRNLPSRPRMRALHRNLRQALRSPRRIPTRMARLPLWLRTTRQGRRSTPPKSSGRLRRGRRSS